MVEGGDKAEEKGEKKAEEEADEESSDEELSSDDEDESGDEEEEEKPMYSNFARYCHARLEELRFSFPQAFLANYSGV